MWETNRGITECDKRTVKCDVEKCDVGIAQCENRSVRCEKKVRESPNLRKKLSHVILKLHNVRMKSDRKSVV